MDHPFRSAAFGGFNRQDVLNYLEHAAKEEKKKLDELRKQLDEARQAASQSGSSLSEQQAKMDALNQENQMLRSQLEKANQDLTASRAASTLNSKLLVEIQREVDSLRAKVAALEPDAQAYAAVKDRTASIELDAHRRAKQIEEEARQGARELRGQAEQCLKKVEQRYDTLRSEVESTVAYAAEQLSKAGQSLEQVVSVMGEQEVALEALEQIYAETDPEKAPAPETEV